MPKKSKNYKVEVLDDLDMHEISCRIDNLNAIIANNEKDIELLKAIVDDLSSKIK